MGYDVRWMMILLRLFVPTAAAVLVLGLCLLVPFAWVWAGIVRERRAVERCLRLHGTGARKRSTDTREMT